MLCCVCSSGIPLAFPQWRDGQLPFNGFADKLEWTVVGTVRGWAGLGASCSHSSVRFWCRPAPSMRCCPPAAHRTCCISMCLLANCSAPLRLLLTAPVHRPTPAAVAAAAAAAAATRPPPPPRKAFDGEFVNVDVPAEAWESGAVQLAVDEDGNALVPRPLGLLDFDEDVRGTYEPEDDAEFDAGGRWCVWGVLSVEGVRQCESVRSAGWRGQTGRWRSGCWHTPVIARVCVFVCVCVVRTAGCAGWPACMGQGSAQGCDHCLQASLAHMFAAVKRH